MYILYFLRWLVTISSILIISKLNEKKLYSVQTQKMKDHFKMYLIFLLFKHVFR